MKTVHITTCERMTTTRTTVHVCEVPDDHVVDEDDLVSTIIEYTKNTVVIDDDEDGVDMISTTLADEDEMKRFHEEVALQST